MNALIKELLAEVSDTTMMPPVQLPVQKCYLLIKPAKCFTVRTNWLT